MEKEQSHRHSMDAESLVVMSSNTKLGQFLGFSLLVFMLLCAIIAMWLDYPWLVTIFLGATLMKPIQDIIKVSSNKNSNN